MDSTVSLRTRNVQSPLSPSLQTFNVTLLTKFQQVGRRTVALIREKPRISSLLDLLVESKKLKDWQYWISVDIVLIIHTTRQSTFVSQTPFLRLLWVIFHHNGFL